MKYLALLRGVNMIGNNIIIMSELKAAFKNQGFENVATYINSGNVMFSSDIADEATLQYKCEKLISDNFNLNIAVCIISADDLRKTIANAPDWWNNIPDAKHDAFFVISPMTAAGIFAHMGVVEEKYEQVAHHGKIVFWSAPMATISRTRWLKISKDKQIYRALTVRSANTALKLAELAWK